MTDTNRLIAQLSHNLRPVRPLRAPSVRAILWIGLVSALIGGSVALIGVRPDLATRLEQPQFLFEWGSALATAIAAAVAAFFASIPGRSSWWPLLPLLPLAAWLLTLGHGIAVDWTAMGWTQFQVPASWACVRFISFVSIPVIIVMLIVLRHAAHLRPVATVLLATLAASAFASAGQDLLHRLHHAAPILVWHGGTIAALILLFCVIGSKLLELFDVTEAAAV